MFFGNLVLTFTLFLSWCFEVISLWKLSWMIRNRSIKQMSALFSGFAVFFSVAGIVTWFIFALIAVQFVDTMSFGVWLLFTIALLQFMCYLHCRYYVRIFNDAAFFRQVLGTDEL